MTIKEKSEIIISLTFTFEKDGKQISIGVNDNDRFQNVINELEEKYVWLQSIKNKTYYFKGKQINNFTANIKELKIVDNSNIVIKC